MRNERSIPSPGVENKKVISDEKRKEFITSLEKLQGQNDYMNARDVSDRKTDEWQTAFISPDRNREGVLPSLLLKSFLLIHS